MAFRAGVMDACSCIVKNHVSSRADRLCDICFCNLVTFIILPHINIHSNYGLCDMPITPPHDFELVWICSRAMSVETCERGCPVRLIDDSLQQTRCRCPDVLVPVAACR